MPKTESKAALKLQPLGDRIVVKRETLEEKTSGGIFLPETAKEKPSRGTVVSVGNGKMMENGHRATPQLKAGDRVIFTSYAPETIKLDEEELLLMREEDVLAVIEG